MPADFGKRLDLKGRVFVKSGEAPKGQSETRGKAEGEVVVERGAAGLVDLGSLGGQSADGIQVILFGSPIAVAPMPPF